MNEVEKMEFVRTIIDANSVMKIIQLPDTLKDRKLEIIILPLDEIQKEPYQKNTNETKAEISKITQSLKGSIPLSDVSLEQIKEERLTKYEGII